MEDPNSRPEAAKVINQVIEEWWGMPTVYGSSLCMRIYYALVEEGFLIEQGIIENDQR